MKAIEIKSPRKIVLSDVQKPVLRRGEVLIKICYVGFCGSDLNTYMGRNALAKSPVIPGHEIGGIIEECGADVPTGLFTKGESVTVNPYTSCGKCSSCRKRRPNACRDNETLGVQRDGAMTDYIAVPWRKLIPTSGLTPLESTLVEPLSVGFHAISRGDVTDSDTVLVIGCGMIGLGAIIRAALRGATVIAMDLDDEKLALASELGATFTVNSVTEDVHSRISALTSDEGPDIVVEAVGSPATYVMAVEEVAFAGRIVCIGYSKSEVTFQTAMFVKKELDIRGSRNALPEDFEAVINYIRKRRFDIGRLVSDTVLPHEASAALKRWANNPSKIFRILVNFQDKL